jgi:hypothetical protein
MPSLGDGDIVGVAPFTRGSTDLRRVGVTAVFAGPAVVTPPLRTTGLCHVRLYVLQTAGPAAGSFFLRAFRGNKGGVFDDFAPIAAIIGTPVSVVFDAIVAPYCSIVLNPPGVAGSNVYTVRLMVCA